MKKRLWEDSLSVQENVASVLPAMASEWFAEGDNAMRDGVAWEDMHRFRLLTKRFRYTLEVFEPLYGRALAGRIELLRELQTYLGDMNDCIATEQMLGLDPALEPVRGSLGTRAERRRVELLRFWQQKFGGPGSAMSWQRYLTRYATRTATTRLLK